MKQDKNIEHFDKQEQRQDKPESLPGGEETTNIIEYISGRITDENEKARLRNWINENDANRELFIRLKNIYAVSRKSTGNIDAGREFMKLNAKIRKPVRRIISEFVKYAAIIAITIGITLVMHDKFFIDRDVKIAMLNEVVCPEGQISELFLSDGTKVWLNGGSRISYPSDFGVDERTVELTGEAFFDVAGIESSGKRKPFVIQTPSVNIQVLGTSFNVEAYDENQFKTTLVEGKVVLQNKDGSIIATMTPGQLAAYDPERHRVIVSEVDTKFYTSWKEGKITFFNEPLEDIALKLERWYNVKIIFGTEDLKSYRFSGTFLKNKPFDQILQIIKLSSPINYTIRINPEEKNEIVLTKSTEMPMR